ncbi:galactose oxidase [Salegentibacter sp. LM13S]|uniref:Kelch repeat-containing protein n=1 Tax=Salegentibacter lacus TaxID=2873599 RepID=UPI001CCCA62F|nr:galactose oxidase [Salegentibacter lacus]MBZ9631594.1 galactose oxidase [Salegentibacter lacus]
MQRKIKYLITAALLGLILTGCSDDDDDFERGNWVSRSVFDGVPRSNAIGFTIDQKGYMGTGYDGDDYMDDFWEYNIEGNYWVQKADFPGTPRTAAVGFATAGKGYLGVGYDGIDELDDFWEYDPATNTWNQKADFMGGSRREAIGFGAEGRGYVGTGYDGKNDRKDFYKYDPGTDKWSEVVGFGGDKRRGATSFSIDGLVYLGTGESNGIYQTDFWVFDPSTEVFSPLNDLDEEDDYYVTRSYAVGFEMEGLGYIATGYSGGALSTIWEYDPLDDTWEEITQLEGTARQDATYFSTGDRAYISMGRSGSLYLDDIYELYPQQEYDDED